MSLPRCGETFLSKRGERFKVPFGNEYKENRFLYCSMYSRGRLKQIKELTLGKLILLLIYDCI